jgi:[acyl-carrier-protein] S-malonyltransferase
MSTGIVFPGLADFKYDRVKDFFHTDYGKKRFEEANEILGLNLLDEFSNENEEYGIYSQCAFLTNTLALFDYAEDKFDLDPLYCIIGSYGGFSGAVYNQSLTFKDSLSLVYQISALEKELQKSKAYGTLFTYKYPLEEIENDINHFQKMDEWLEVSGHISTSIYSICGSVKTLEKVKEHIKSKRMGRSLHMINRLIHCSKLESLEKESANTIFNKIQFQPLRIPTISDLHGELIMHQDELKEVLLKGISKPLRWDLTVRTMKRLGIDEVFIIGSVDVLGPVLKDHFKVHIISTDHVLSNM